MRQSPETLRKDIVDLLSLTSRRFYQLDRDEEMCCGLTLSQCLVLKTVDEHVHMRMSELSKAMGLTASTMSRVVANLVRQGYLRREHDEEDRRVTYVALTDSGVKMADELKKREREYRKRLVDRIPDDKLDAVASALRLLLNAARRKGGDCCP